MTEYRIPIYVLYFIYRLSVFHIIHHYDSVSWNFAFDNIIKSEKNKWKRQNFSTQFLTYVVFKMDLLRFFFDKLVYRDTHIASRVNVAPMWSISKKAHICNLLYAGISEISRLNIQISVICDIIVGLRYLRERQYIVSKFTETSGIFQ